jgi:hypothetical protein
MHPRSVTAEAVPPRQCRNAPANGAQITLPAHPATTAGSDRPGGDQPSYAHLAARTGQKPSRFIDRTFGKE